MADCKEDTDTYSSYKYTTWCDGEHMGTWMYAIHLQYDYQADIESDECYDTREDAMNAACEHIDRLQDGDIEPDYNAPTADERYQQAHEGRRKLRGY